MSFDHPEYDQIKNPTVKNNCPKCKGRGVTYVPNSSPPISVRCQCGLKVDLAYNMENGWRGLSKAAGVENSALLKYARSNMWITTPTPEFRNHLKFVAESMGHKWFFKVTSDSELVSIWLSKLGNEVNDPDFYGEQIPEDTNLNRFSSIPDLLIIQLGIKVASNKETPSVVQEVVSLRYHLDKPTWVVDQPYCKLEPGHKCYSRNLIDSLSMYEYHRYSMGDVQPQVKSVNGFTDSPMPVMEPQYRPDIQRVDQPLPPKKNGKVFADDGDKPKFKKSSFKRGTTEE